MSSTMRGEACSARSVRVWAVRVPEVVVSDVVVSAGGAVMVNSRFRAGCCAGSCTGGGAADAERDAEQVPGHEERDPDDPDDGGDRDGEGGECADAGGQIGRAHV